MAREDSQRFILQNLPNPPGIPTMVSLAADGKNLGPGSGGSELQGSTNHIHEMADTPQNRHAASLQPRNGPVKFFCLKRIRNFHNVPHKLARAKDSCKINQKSLVMDSLKRICDEKLIQELREFLKTADHKKVGTE